MGGGPPLQSSSAGAQKKPLPDVLTQGEKSILGGGRWQFLNVGFLCSIAAVTATSPPSSPTCTRAASSLCQRARAAVSSRGTAWTWGWQLQVRAGPPPAALGSCFPSSPFPSSPFCCPLRSFSSWFFCVSFRSYGKVFNVLAKRERGKDLVVVLKPFWRSQPWAALRSCGLC